MSEAPLHALLVGGAAGFAGLAHCLGMCGPLAVVTSHGRGGVWQYAAARVFAYVMLGFTLGAIGAPLVDNLPSWLGKVLAWTVVSLMIAAAIRLFWPRRQRQTIAFGKKRHSFIARLMNAAARYPLLAGLATPLLPCGLVYMMAVPAAATGAAIDGALLLGAFATTSGIGLLAAALLSKRVRVTNGWLRPAAAIALLVAAALMASRAMNDTTPNPESGVPACHGHGHGGAL